MAALPEGTVRLLPASHGLVPGRRVVGATLRSRNLDALRRVLAGSAPKIPQPAAAGCGSIFLPPAATGGLWLEFQQQP